MAFHTRVHSIRMTTGSRGVATLFANATGFRRQTVNLCLLFLQKSGDLSCQLLVLGPGSKTSLYAGNVLYLRKTGNQESFWVGQAAFTAVVVAAYRRGAGPCFSVAGAFFLTDCPNAWGKQKLCCVEKLILSNGQLRKLLLQKGVVHRRTSLEYSKSWDTGAQNRRRTSAGSFVCPRIHISFATTASVVMS